MTVRRAAARRRNAGFTLIEALIATAMMAIILAGLATVTAQWLPNWNAGFARIQRADALALGLERLVADVSAAEFVSANRGDPHPVFDGRELSVTFVRTAIGPNAGPGLELVRIAETAGAQGPMLVRTTAPFAPFTPSTVLPNFTAPVVLLRAPYRVSFSYAGDDRTWRDTWHRADRLPHAVRLRVRNAVTGRTVSFTTVAVVHAEVPVACAASPRNCFKQPPQARKSAAANAQPLAKP